MTLEQILLAGLSAVTSALVYVCGLLWARFKRVESDLDDLRKEHDALTEAHGIATGTLSLYRRCKVPACPFAEMTPSAAH